MYMVLFVSLCLLVSLAVYLGANKYFGNVSPIKLTIINFVSVYIFFVLGVYCYEIYLEYRLDSFDLNGDGIFTGEENTPEKEKYMSLVINDTFRTFAPFTGLVFSFLYAALFLCASKLNGFESKLYGFIKKRSK
jgi:hypothetical protein